MGSLRILNIACNMINDQTIMGMISNVNLPKLKILDLSSNRLCLPQTVSAILSHLPALRTFNMARNTITGELLLDGVTPVGLKDLYL